MHASPLMVTLVLTLLWFAIYWVVAGVIFAVISLARFMRINTLRFSCLFTIMSAATAYAAAWTSFSAASRPGERCLANIDMAYQAVPRIFQCAPQLTIANGILWFIILLAVGVALLFISRLPDRSRYSNNGRAF